jgi:hypothetical protein
VLLKQIRRPVIWPLSWPYYDHREKRARVGIRGGPRDNISFLRRFHGVSLREGAVPWGDSRKRQPQSSAPIYHRNNSGANRLFGGGRASSCALPVGKVGNQPRQGPRLGSFPASLCGGLLPVGRTRDPNIRLVSTRIKDGREVRGRAHAHEWV